MLTPLPELYQLAVHPSHRRQRIGSMLMEWGTQRASELGVGMVVVAVRFAVPVYEEGGFGVVGRVNADLAWQGEDGEESEK